MSLNRFLPIKSILLIFIILIGEVCACKRDEIIDTNIIFIGHKANGNNIYHDDAILENTLPAAKFAMQTMDGVELDVQVSLDGTIWVYHNSSVYEDSCISGDPEKEIPAMNDSEIEQLIICHDTKKDRLYRLTELVNYWNNYPNGFYLSLDVKDSFSAKSFTLGGGRNNYLIRFVKSFSKIFEQMKNPKKLFLEFHNPDFIPLIRKLPNGSDFNLFLIVEKSLPDDIIAAKADGFNGVSCNYKNPTVNTESIKLAHDEGLMVQLWTPYYRDELRIAFAMAPDVIQSDNMFAKQALRIK